MPASVSSKEATFEQGRREIQPFPAEQMHPFPALQYTTFRKNEFAPGEVVHGEESVASMLVSIRDKRIVPL